MIELRALGPAELSGPEGTDPSSVLARPKLLGLLSFLAAGPARGYLRRDVLIGLFWTELDQDRARSAVRQSLYRLRLFLGEGVVETRGDEEVALSESGFWCDVVAFEDALERGDRESALKLYRGDFLEGLYVSDAPEYERWLDGRRKELRQRASEAAWQLADQKAIQRDTAAAGHWSRQARGLEPLDERLLRRVIQLLDRLGDRAGAVREYETFARRLAEELELEPSPETKDLVDRVRRRAEVAVGQRPPPLAPVAPGSERGLAQALKDRYAIEREIGAGGMATVYLARDLRHDRDVAVKVMNPELAATMGAERFLREIKIAASLTHPHIVPLYDSGLADGFLYYVMPHIEGESLRDRLGREGQLPLDDALAIARDVADALGHAHSLGVVHRDIKPENILLSGGHALVADFGIAHAVTAATATRLTQSGIALGTPPYMSPEQGAGGGELDGRSDVYSLGCVLYEMLGGQPPFTGPTAESIARQHLTTQPRPVTELRPTVPENVATAIRRALSKTPADRFHPAAQFADALGAGGTPAAVRPVEPRASRRPWVMGVVGAVAALCVAAALMFQTGGAPGPASDRPTLAVLPFENLGAPEDDYFADGITEEITSRLARLSGLGVVSRTSALRYRGTSLSLREVAEELGVAYVLEGTVRTDRGEGRLGKVRVTPQLIRASDDTHLWTEPYTVQLAPGEIFEAQTTIAERVAAALSVSLLTEEREALNRRPTDDPAAHEAYLQGLYHWNRRTAEDLQRAAQYFADAAARDPQYADAYAGLADAYALFPLYQVPSLSRSEAHARAESSARRALELDSTLASARASLGFALMYGWWGWEEAETAFRRALASDPDCVKAHYWYAELLYIRGRFEEALAHATRAVELEPAVPIVHHILGWVLLCMERFDEAEAALRTALDLEPGFLGGHIGLAMIAAHRADWETSIQEMTAWGMAPEIAQAVIAVQRDPSEHVDAANLVNERLRSGQPPDPASAAMVYMLIGATDSAYAWSARAVTARSEMFSSFIRLPTLRGGFADARVRDLVRSMGLEP